MWRRERFLRFFLVIFDGTVCPSAALSFGSLLGPISLNFSLCLGAFGYITFYFARGIVLVASMLKSERP